MALTIHDVDNRNRVGMNAAKSHGMSGNFRLPGEWTP